MKGYLGDEIEGGDQQATGGFERLAMRLEDNTARESIFGLEVSPVVVVGPGNCAGESGDECLHASPEVKPFEEGIHPAVDDAVVGVEAALVVLVVLLVVDDESRLLQEDDGSGRFGVDHVRPLVALVGEDAQHHAEDDHPVEGLRAEVRRRRVVGQPDHEGHRVGRVEAGLGEAVQRDVLRIDVMHPEGADHRRPEDRSLELSPGVRRPVGHSRNEIHEELRRHEADEDGERAGVVFDGPEDEEVPEVEGEEEVGEFPEALGPGVAVHPQLLHRRLAVFCWRAHQNITQQLTGPRRFQINKPSSQQKGSNLTPVTQNPLPLHASQLLQIQAFPAFNQQRQQFQLLPVKSDLVGEDLPELVEGDEAVLVLVGLPHHFLDVLFVEVEVEILADPAHSGEGDEAGLLVVEEGEELAHFLLRLLAGDCLVEEEEEALEVDAALALLVQVAGQLVERRPHHLLPLLQQRLLQICVADALPRGLMLPYWLNSSKIDLISCTRSRLRPGRTYCISGETASFTICRFIRLPDKYIHIPAMPSKHRQTHRYTCK